MININYSEKTNYQYSTDLTFTISNEIASLKLPIVEDNLLQSLKTCILEKFKLGSFITLNLEDSSKCYIVKYSDLEEFMRKAKYFHSFNQEEWVQTHINLIKSGQPIDKVLKEKVEERTRELHQLQQVFAKKISYKEFREKIEDIEIKESGKPTRISYNIYQDKNMLDKTVDLYIRRFLEIYPEMNKIEFLSALKFTALCIAIKSSNDEETIWNEDFFNYKCINIGEFVESPRLKNNLIRKAEFIQKINLMEQKFLQVIHWDVSLRELE